MRFMAYLSVMDRSTVIAIYGCLCYVTNLNDVNMVAPCSDRWTEDVIVISISINRVCGSAMVVFLGVWMVRRDYSISASMMRDGYGLYRDIKRQRRNGGISEPEDMKE
jgi:hypothetical protein